MLEYELLLDKSCPEKKAIVVVEDNEQIAELIKDTLNAEPDYQAVMVHDGAAALEVIRSVKASLILLEVMLPGIDGLQVYDMLRESEDTRHIPVLFITAAHVPNEFRKREIRTYIVKPFSLDELLGSVAEVCRS